MIVIQHLKRQEYSRICKKLKTRIESLLDDLNIEPCVELDKIRNELKGAVDNQYLGTLVAFYDISTNKVLVGFSQFNIPGELPQLFRKKLIKEGCTFPEDFETLSCHEFDRRRGILMAQKRAVKYANKTLPDIKAMFKGEQIPGYIMRALPKFLFRAKAYFKDKQFVEWTDSI